MGSMTGIIPTVDQIEALHRKLAPSDAAYDLIHTHCVIVAQITRQLIHRRNALFMRRCTLPSDAPERTGEAMRRLWCFILGQGSGKNVHTSLTTPGATAFMSSGAFAKYSFIVFPPRFFFGI